MITYYIVNCKHYPTDRCNKPNTDCIFEGYELKGLGCQNLKLDWIAYIKYKECITLVKEVKEISAYRSYHRL